jgi:hypothetical protein
MAYAFRNLDRKDRQEVSAIRRRAEKLKTQLTAQTFL